MISTSVAAVLRTARVHLAALLLPLGVGTLGAVSACGPSPERSADRRSEATNIVESPDPTLQGGLDDFGEPLPTDARFATRVVSLNPAATEVIFAMGADSALVGRSRWDEFPAEASRIMPLGDAIRPSIETVLSVQPSLVILYATPDNRAAAEALRRAGVRTVALRANRIEGFFALTRQLGVMLGATARAEVVVDSVRQTLDRVRRLTAAQPERPTVVWPVWESPPMVIGGGSYLDEVLTIAGAHNVFHDDTTASPSVSIEEIARRDPRHVIVGSTRLAAMRESSTWRAVTAVREGRLMVVDQDVTGRPSVMLGMAATQLARLLHPALSDSLR